MSEHTMTEAEQSLSDDKMRAEIGKLITETQKLKVEIFWYPIAIATGLVGAIAGATAIIIKFFGS